MHGARVVAALRGDDDRQLGELIDIVSVLERWRAFSERWGGRASLGRREEHRVDTGEIPFILHALHEDRTHHAAVTDKTYSLRSHSFKATRERRR